MKLLLDTHTFLWWDNEPERLSGNVLAEFASPANQLWLSLASVWEIQIKLQIAKLNLRLPLADVLEYHLRQGIKIAPIEVGDVLQLAEMPMAHRDPFDRIIVAQARHGGFRLVTRDPRMEQYEVLTLW